MMNTPTEQKMHGTWMQFRGKLQEMWGDLTDDELDQLEGKRDQLVGYIEKKTGQTRQAVRDGLDRIAKDIKYSF